MRLNLVAAAAAFVAMGTAVASAAPTVHDTVVEFSDIAPAQTLQANGGPVAGNRSDISKMFDNDLNTIWSPGIGGSITFVITPLTNMLTSGAVIELTNRGSNHREEAQVYLGVNGGSFVYIGDLLNAEFAGGPQVQNANASVATLGLVANGNNTSYTLNILDGMFNSLRIVDISPSAGGGNRDGFDIAELEVTSVPVPEPASMALFGAGLLGLVAANRRRRRTQA